MLRKGAGEPERRLWNALREMLSEAKFRRQVPFGLYHADFCSHAAKLIVEVDGDDHAARAEKDAARTRFLEGEDYLVMRVSNADVITNVEGVVTAISARFAENGKSRP